MVLMYFIGTYDFWAKKHATTENLQKATIVSKNESLLTYSAFFKKNNKINKLVHKTIIITITDYGGRNKKYICITICVNQQCFDFLKTKTPHCLVMTLYQLSIDLFNTYNSNLPKNYKQSEYLLLSSTSDSILEPKVRTKSWHVARSHLG